MPYSSLEAVIERTKPEYYLALRRMQASLRTPPQDWQPWLEHFLGAMTEQIAQLERRLAHREIAWLARTALRGDRSARPRAWSHHDGRGDSAHTRAAPHAEVALREARRTRIPRTARDRQWHLVCTNGRTRGRRMSSSPICPSGISLSMRAGSQLACSKPGSLALDRCTMQPGGLSAAAADRTRAGRVGRRRCRRAQARRSS